MSTSATASYSSLCGVVLCGGRSSRMGSDKATIEVDGVAMASRVACALRGAGCAPVWCQGGDATALGALGLTVVADREPGAGPLPAIATALARAFDSERCDAAVVAACDLPQLSSTAIAALLTGLADGASVAALGDPDGAHLVSVWRPSALELLAVLLVDGRRGYRAALAELGATIVDLRAAGIDPATVRNVNTSADL